MTLTLVADENIAGLESLFTAPLRLKTLPGRAIRAGDLREADALLVRSVTRVDAGLLEDSHVSFVGSATSGLDHVDLDYLRDHGIAFASAPGANADSVADYVFSALAVLNLEHGLDWPAARFGIIGAGRIGGRLRHRLCALGADVSVCDPFLEPADVSPARLCDLDRVLDSDIITLHTPLTDTGPHPTRHLLGSPGLSRLAAGQVLINAARGPVVDNTALLHRLDSAAAPRVVLDTWEGEPVVDPALLARVDLGTPHIAGYSLDGKLRATAMLHEAFCRHFGLSGAEAGAAGPSGHIDLPPKRDGEGRSRWLSRCILSAYDLRRDDRRMRDLLALAPGEQSRDFDRQRREYPDRREFGHFLFPAERFNADDSTLLAALGFSPDQAR